VDSSAHNTLLTAQAIGRQHPAADGWLLRDISLTIAKGDRVALVGPSGSGKTLLARALSLLDPIHQGQVLWNNHPIESERVPSFRRRVVYLHQRPWLGEGTVEDALRQPWTFRSAESSRRENSPAYDRERIARWFKIAGRESAIVEQRTHNLSGGETQIVALIRALQLDPHILLLDEPTAAMDQETTGAAESLIQDWYEELPGRRATLWITHNTEQTSRVSKRVISINKGRLESP